MEREGKVRVERAAGASPMVYPAGREAGQSTGSKNVTNTSSLPHFPLPTTPEWDIEVCSVSSTNQVHLWLGGAKDQLKSLHTAMLVHHRNHNIRHSPVGVGLYSGLVSGDQCRRVRVVQVDRINYTCRCLLLDYGEEVVLDWSVLAELDMKFRQLPVQAVKASLAGVEKNSEKKVVEFVKRCLVGVLVEVNNTTPALVLFYTSQEEDTMVSEEIIRYTSNISDPNNNTPPDQNPLDPPPSHLLPTPRVYAITSPPLPQVGEYFDLVVSHIVSPYQFYVQSHTSLSNYKSLPSQLAAHYTTNGPTLSTTDLTPGSCLALLECNTWHRVRLVRSLSSSVFILRLLDTGRMVAANKELIRPLSRQFGQLPSQAIRARLARVNFMDDEVEWGEKAVDWFRHVALGKCLVGLVEDKLGEEVMFTMYDTSVQDVDTVINTEMVALRLSMAREK